MSWGRVSLHTALRTMMPCTQFHAGRCLFCLITFCYLSFLWFLMHPCGLCEAIFYLAIHKSLFFHHCRKTLTDWPGYLELAVTLITLVFCFVSFFIKIVIGKILVYFFFYVLSFCDKLFRIAERINRTSFLVEQRISFIMALFLKFWIQS